MPNIKARHFKAVVEDGRDGWDRVFCDPVFVESLYHRGNPALRGNLMKFSVGILAIPGLFFALSCAQPAQPDLEAARQALLQRDREWSQAASGDDLERLLSFWADDAVIYPAGAPAVVGKDAIRQFLKEKRNIPGFSISWEPTDAVVSGSADLAYTLGTMQIGANDAQGNPVVNQGKYSVVWRRQTDGSWTAVVDMFNFDQPPAAPSPAPEE